MTTDDGKHAPTAAELREFVCSVEGGPVPTTFPAHVYWKAIEARLNSHATLLRERDELRRALERIAALAKLRRKQTGLPTQRHEDYERIANDALTASADRKDGV